MFPHPVGVFCTPLEPPKWHIMCLCLFCYVCSCICDYLSDCLLPEKPLAVNSLWICVFVFRFVFAFDEWLPLWITCAPPSVGAPQKPLVRAPKRLSEFTVEKLILPVDLLVDLPVDFETQVFAKMMCA